MNKIILHPNYDDEIIRYDYAIIRLTERIIFSPVANAACLPSFTDIATTDGKFMTISGWGLTEFYSDYDYVKPTVLQEAMIQGINISRVHKKLVFIRNG